MTTVRALPRLDLGSPRRRRMAFTLGSGV